MSNQSQSIQQIKQAEEQAAILCRVAQEKAAEMRANALAEAEAGYRDTVGATEAELAETLEAMRQRAAALESKKRTEALDEAAAMQDAARLKMSEAVQLIVWEIIEKCQ